MKSALRNNSGKAAFFWSPFVHSDEIKVSVDGGMATLTGTVGTWIGWGEADRDARRSGATGVVNRVRSRRAPGVVAEPRRRRVTWQSFINGGCG